MALTWTDKVDGQDIILADDINGIAHAVQDAEAAAAAASSDAAAASAQAADAEETAAAAAAGLAEKLDAEDAPRVFFGVAIQSGTARTAVLTTEGAERFDTLTDGDVFFVRFASGLTQGSAGQNVAITVAIQSGDDTTESVPLVVQTNRDETSRMNPKHRAWAANAVVRMVYRAAHTNGNNDIPAYFMASGLRYAVADGYLGGVALAGEIAKDNGQYINDYRVPTQKAVADFVETQIAARPIVFRVEGIDTYTIFCPRGTTWEQVIESNANPIVTLVGDDGTDIWRERTRLLRVNGNWVDGRALDMYGTVAEWVPLHDANHNLIKKTDAPEDGATYSLHAE